MYDIITFGSAAQDIHLKSKEFKTLSGDKDFTTGMGICLTLGAKVNIDDIIYTTGGGGTNTAATFAKQGFRTAFCGGIGVDASGLGIVRELKILGIDTRFVVKKKEKHTNTSVIISNEGEDRTILVYRGASDILTEKNIPLNKLKKTQWFYLAPLTDLLCDRFEDIVLFANENEIKVAVNPSKEQLSLPEEKLRSILKKVDILFLNQEEASFLTKVSFSEEIEIFKKMIQLCPGVCVMTKGKGGVVVSDGKHIYSAKADQSKRIVDATGAGDSFASGFLSDYIRHDKNIEKAIQFGMANSLANLMELGAKNGLLGKDDEFEKVQITKRPV